MNKKKVIERKLKNDGIKIFYGKKIISSKVIIDVQPAFMNDFKCHGVCQ